MRGLPHPPCPQATLPGTGTARAGKHQPLPHLGSVFQRGSRCLQASRVSTCHGRKGPKHPTSVQERVPQTLPGSVCAPFATPIGFGLSIPLHAVQAECTVCLGVLESSPNRLHNLCVTVGQEVCDLYTSWQNIRYCPRALSGMVSAADLQSKSTLSSLRGSRGVRRSAKGHVLLHSPWCRPNYTADVWQPPEKPVRRGKSSRRGWAALFVH